MNRHLILLGDWPAPPAKSGSSARAGCATAAVVLEIAYEQLVPLIEDAVREGPVELGGGAVVVRALERFDRTLAGGRILGAIRPPTPGVLWAESAEGGQLAVALRRLAGGADVGRYAARARSWLEKLGTTGLTEHDVDEVRRMIRAAGRSGRRGDDDRGTR